MMKTSKGPSGFSMIELLVTISVLGILMGLLLPAVQHVRATAARISCQNNMKQIGLALHSYHDRNGRLPPGIELRQPTGMLGWMAHILPDVEQDSLYRNAVNACQQSFDTWSNPPHTGLTAVVSTFVCPMDGRLTMPQTNPQGVSAGFASYVGTAGIFITFSPRAESISLMGAMPGSRFAEITDGLSNTLLTGERPPPDSFQAGVWYPVVGPVTQGAGPDGTIYLGDIRFYGGDVDCPVARTVHFGPGRADNPCDRYHLWSFHPGGANFLFADGSVRFLNYSARPLIPALISRSGGEVIEFP